MPYDIGPPKGPFPIASLFILTALFVSMYEVFVLGGFNPLIRNLAFGTFVMMMVFAVFGAWFQKKHMVGQLLFVAVGVVAVLFTDQITTVLHLQLALVPLSWTAPVSVVLLVNGADYTWLFWVALLVAVVLTRHDLKPWAMRAYHIINK